MSAISGVRQRSRETELTRGQYVRNARGGLEVLAMYQRSKARFANGHCRSRSILLVNLTNARRSILGCGKLWMEVFLEVRN